MVCMSLPVHFLSFLDHEISCEWPDENVRSNFKSFKAHISNTYPAVPWFPTVPKHCQELEGCREAVRTVLSIKTMRNECSIWVERINYLKTKQRSEPMQQNQGLTSGIFWRLAVQNNGQSLFRTPGLRRIAVMPWRPPLQRSCTLPRTKNPDRDPDMLSLHFSASARSDSNRFLMWATLSNIPYLLSGLMPSEFGERIVAHKVWDSAKRYHFLVSIYSFSKPRRSLAVSKTIWIYLTILNNHYLFCTILHLSMNRTSCAMGAAKTLEFNTFDAFLLRNQGNFISDLATPVANMSKSWTVFTPKNTSNSKKVKSRSASLIFINRQIPRSIVGQPAGSRRTKYEKMKK